ncbi:hypothetical protein HQ520_06845 [bacterium]|nr:hypothetical protein [bacterium]
MTAIRNVFGIRPIENKKQHILPLILLGAALLIPSQGKGTTVPVKNDLYRIEVSESGDLTLHRKDAPPRLFQPRFTVLFSSTDPDMALRPADTKGVRYNVPSWQTGKKEQSGGVVQVTDLPVGDGFDPEILGGDTEGRTADVFRAAPLASIAASGVQVADGQITWTFPEHPGFQMAAYLILPAGEADPILTMTLTPRQEGWYSLGYTGAPAVDPERLDEVWQPMIWQQKRFPHRSFLTFSSFCTIPATLAEWDGATVGVVADPAELPFMPLPTRDNPLFGVTVRNLAGLAQPIVFAPVFGGDNSRRRVGEAYSFTLRLVVHPGSLSDTFVYMARRIYDFRDMRSNSFTTLNQTLQNMMEYSLSEYAVFDETLKGFSYQTDVPGSVKNVSSLHPMSLSLVTDDAEFYERRARLLVEFMLSRENNLFTLDPNVKGQGAKTGMNGPCASVAELLALYIISGRNTPVFLELAKQQAEKEEGPTWHNQLMFYRATGDASYLEKAQAGADSYIQEKVETAQTEWEGRGSFFWTSFNADWIALFDLYEETGEKRYLDAAHETALRYIQFVWYAPRVPDEMVTVNEGNQAPVYWYLKSRTKGPMPVPETTVPAWRVSAIGLTPESAGTSHGHRGIFLANPMAYMLRLAGATGDDFLADTARWAAIGRYANFPGYHMNTARTTVYEQADYPMRPFEELSYNSFHFNHVFPQMAFLIDYLVSEAKVRSRGQISFPGLYAKGYAYLQSNIYGYEPGSFYGDDGVWLWMPRDLLRTDNIELNYISGRGNGNLYMAFSNESQEPVTARVNVNSQLVAFEKGREYPVRRIAQNGEEQRSVLVDGGLEVRVAPIGITALIVEGAPTRPRFQNRFGGAEALPAKSFATIDQGGTHGMLLSFGPSLTSAYVYLEATSREIRQAVLQYRIGDRSGEIADDSYPFEFTVPLEPEDTSFAFRILTTNPEGKTERSEEILLEK